MIPLGTQPERLAQGSHRAGGVVLRRREGSGHKQDLLLFLQDMGATWVGAHGAGSSKNRFGGGTEPMMWGTFDLYQSPRRLYLKGVDVREDFWRIRERRASLYTAVGWCGALSSRLPAGLECNALLSLLWGSMKNLSEGAAPVLTDMRFAWRWGNLWGVAPSLEQCVHCGRDISSSEGGVIASQDGFLCESCRGSAPESPVPARFSLPAHAAQTLRRAAMLGREAYLAWAREWNEMPSESLKPVQRWLYSFLQSGL